MLDLPIIYPLKKAPDRIQILKSIYEEEFQRAAEKMLIAPLKLTPNISYLRYMAVRKW